MSDAVIALSPVTHDARLPEAFDIVRAIPLPPVTTTATTDGDLLIATTAAFHGHEFATSEVGLAEGLRLVAGFPMAVHLVPLE